MCDEFLLHSGYEQNYEALCNFLNDTLAKKRKWRGLFNAKRFKLKHLAKQDFKCLDCSREFHINEHGSYSTATADHIIPFRYGSTISMNLEFV